MGGKVCMGLPPHTLLAIGGVPITRSSTSCSSCERVQSGREALACSKGAVASYFWPRFKEFQEWRRPEKRAKFADGPIPSFPWSYVAPLVGLLVGPSVGPLVGNNVENVNRHIPNTFIHIDTKLMRVMATIFQQCLPLAALSASANSRHGPSAFVSHVFLLSMVSGVAVALRSLRWSHP